VPAGDEPPPSSLATAGERVGPYRVLNMIGRGGTGVVFRAQHTESGEIVALKRLLVESVADIGGMRREIAALRRLEHPGVVRILDQGVDAAVPWYAMELLEGETLASYVARLWRVGSSHCSDFAATLTEQSLRNRESRAPQLASEAPRPVAHHGRELVAQGTLHEVLEIVRCLCDTLAFVHGEGVVHRDLKCANVMLCSGGVPKLLDFGLAWRFPGGTGREVLDDVTRGAAGTAAYMPPEQIRGEMVDARADLYSLGCLLYELLTGRLPFTGRSAAEVRRCHLNVAVLPPSSLVDGVPPVLDDLVLRLLQKRVEDRPGHASEVARSLSSLGAVRAFWGSETLPRSYVYRSALVGRDETLRLLRAHVDRARTSQGSLLTLSGESGVGKTYLALAAARDAASQGLRVVTSTCLPLGVGAAHSNEASLHPFRSLLLAIADRCIAAPELTPALLGERAKLLVACEPSLGALPGVSGYPEPEPLPAGAAQQRLLQALAETLAAFAAVCPFVFVIDDLQWADDTSLRFLSSLPDDWLSDKPLVIVGLYRADEQIVALQDLLRRPYVEKLHLDRLPEPSLGELVRGMLALGAAPASFVDLFVKQSEGNPFFAAEYLRTAVDERLLYRAPGGDWQIDDRLLANDGAQPRLTLPGSIAALVGRRLDGLSAPAQRVLAAAAVLGRETEWPLLLAVAELPEEAAWEPARELVAHQILEEPGLGERDATRLRFLHDKLRETAHARIPGAQRCSLHRRAADALEQMLEGSPELRQAHATLAYHHTEGEQPREALEHLELAGDHALRTYANRDAMRHFGTALELDARMRQAALSGQAEPARAPGRNALHLANLRRARWERRLAEAHYALGDLDAVERHTLRALEHTGHSPPRSALGWNWSLLRELTRQLFHRAAPAWTRRRPNALEQDTLVEAALATHHLAERSYYNFEAEPARGQSRRARRGRRAAGHALRHAGHDCGHQQAPGARRALLRSGTPSRGEHPRSGRARLLALLQGGVEDRQRRVARGAGAVRGVLAHRGADAQREGARHGSDAARPHRFLHGAVSAERGYLPAAGADGSSQRGSAAPLLGFVRRGTRPHLPGGAGRGARDAARVQCPARAAGRGALQDHRPGLAGVLTPARRGSARRTGSGGAHRPAHPQESADGIRHRGRLRRGGRGVSRALGAVAARFGAHTRGPLRTPRCPARRLRPAGAGPEHPDRLALLPPQSRRDAAPRRQPAHRPVGLRARPGRSTPTRHAARRGARPPRPRARGGTG
jgi:serine/threonine protein kinase